MNWLLIAIIAHFLFASVFIIDKFLLSKTVLNPIIYAFYIGLLEIFVLVLIPFGFIIPPLEQVIASFLAGALFIFGLIFLYKSFRLSEVSKIAPVVGGAIPVFTLILTRLFLGERLLIHQSIAFSLLVIGGIVILWPEKHKKISELLETFLIRSLFIALLAAFLFAGSFVLTKFVFAYQPFINGFIWIRLGGFLGACLIFFWPGNRQIILDTTKAIKIKTISLFSINKGIAGLAFILLNYAIFLGSVTLVNALQGVQYAFLFIVTVILSKKFPQILREQISRRIVIRKVIAILLIGLGLGILAF